MGQSVGKGLRASSSSLGKLLSLYLLVFTNPEVLWNPFILDVFKEGSLHIHD